MGITTQFVQVATEAQSRRWYLCVRALNETPSSATARPGAKRRVPTTMKARAARNLATPGQVINEP
jgi:hypothetical protein